MFIKRGFAILDLVHTRIHYIETVEQVYLVFFMQLLNN